MNMSARVSTAGLVGLAALTIVLVGLAIRSNDPTPPGSTSGSNDSAAASGAVSSAPSLTPTATATITATTTTATTTAPAPLQTILVAINGQQAWRIRVGSCAEGGATVATTTNGGATWARAKTPLATIVRVRPTDGRTAFVIGANTNCAAELQNTSDAGATWSSGGAVGSAWFRDPKNPLVVRTPGPANATPCGKQEVLDLAVISNGSARVLCADGQVRSTTDTGASWTNSGKVSGAVALAVSATAPGQTYVAVLGAPGCAGVQIRVVDKRTPTSCVPAAVPKTPGQIALSLVGGSGWLSVGDTTLLSTGKLITWKTS